MGLSEDLVHFLFFLKDVMYSLDTHRGRESM